MKIILLFLVLFQLSCTKNTKEIIVGDDLPNFNEMWDYSNPTKTRDEFTRILGSLNDKTKLSYTLELKTQIARTYSLQAKFDEAHKLLDEVETQLNQDTSIAQVRYLLERGRAFNSAKKKNKAKVLFIDAFEKSKKLATDNYTIDAAHMVAIAASKLEDKLEWNTNGLVAAKKSKDKKVKRWIGVFLNNMGWDLFEVKRYEEALANFRACWDFYEESKTNDRRDIARWSYAKTLRLMGKTEDSIKIQIALLDEKNGKDDSGYGFEELGELYLLKDDKVKSESNFSKAYEILSKDIWLQKNEKERLDRIKQLAE
jgi:hypothetical protein